MADQIFIRPAREGLIVRDPISKQALPAAGRWVSAHTMYWRRRVLCGDVVVASPPQADSAPEAKPAPVAPAAPKTTRKMTDNRG